LVGTTLSASTVRPSAGETSKVVGRLTARSLESRTVQVTADASPAATVVGARAVVTRSATLPDTLAPVQARS
jgi:hypothetical protein